ncbi:unnamed protein product [Rotaria socialis]|uniref:Calponin-homology (CH) domain-containing protein n=1 Tax=Rotaria socialis TaxID=392032 RepID=A0A820WMR0_9BILA|nr:unnamed protein product [Rotaria socialis]
MFLFPKSGLRRFLLLVIIISTLSYMVLNIVSFAGTPWITTNVENIQFGLWKVCDKSTNGSCNQWSDRVYNTNTTRNTFSRGKPSYIRTSQALEIISLIFYAFAAALIIIGIINSDGLPYIFMFLGATALLFVAMVFLSATLCVMSVQGRSNRISAFLDWAWWNGMVGLIMTIICFFALIALILDMKFSSVNRQIPKLKRKPKQTDIFVAQQTVPYPMSMPVTLPPIIAPNTFVTPPMSYENYYGYNYQNTNNYFPLPENNLHWIIKEKRKINWQKSKAMSWEMQLDQSLLEDLYLWIDSLSLSRPKQRIERDFSDGVLVAEIVHYYLPEFIDLHNYTPANSLGHKRSNWQTLNKKFLSNLGLDLSDVIINGLSNGKPGLIEVLLFNLRLKIDEQLELKEKSQQQSLLSSIDDKTKSYAKGKLINNSFKPTNKNISNLNYEEIKQVYFNQEEQIEILQAKVRRLEHVLKLKDIRINQLSSS